MTGFLHTSVLLVIALLFTRITSTPIPVESEPSSTTEASTNSSSTDDDFSPPSLVVQPDDEHDHPKDDPQLEDDDSESTKQKRQQAKITVTQLEARRQAFLKTLGGGAGEGDDAGGGGGGGGALLSSIQGLGSLASDVVSLVNLNETFAPLREVQQKVRASYPSVGETLNRSLKSGGAYARRAYRGVLKALRVTVTNIIRVALAAITRLSSTVGGFYQVFLSVLDIVTRAITRGVGVGSSLLSVGSDVGVRALERGTEILKNVASTNVLLKPVNQAVSVGRGLAKGISEDLFDKVEWTQEGIKSKLELAQALAPNFLLHAHEKTSDDTASGIAEDLKGSHRPPLDIIPDDKPSNLGGSSSSSGSLSQLDSEDEAALLSLSSNIKETSMRDGREANSSDIMSIMKDSSSTTTTETTKMTEKSTEPKSSPPMPLMMMILNQTLLNDIFGLQEEVQRLRSLVNANDAKSLRNSSGNQKLKNS